MHKPSVHQKIDSSPKNKFFGIYYSVRSKIFNNPAKFAVFVLILSFYASLLIHKIDLPNADDLPRHIKNGEMILNGHFEVLKSNTYSYTEPDHEFINHHWLSGVIFYALFQLGDWNMLILFKAVILVAAFAIIFFTSLKKAPFWLVAIFSIPTILLLSGRTTLRPEIFSYLFIAIYLFALTSLQRNPTSNKIFWLVPLQILWVNLHIFYPIGTLIIAGFMVEEAILNFKSKNWKVLKKLTALLCISMLSFLINPNGIKGAFEAFTILKQVSIQISENQSVVDFTRNFLFWDDISIGLLVPFALALLASFLIKLSQARKRIFYFVASAGTLTLGFFLIRTIPLFALIFLPTISANFSSYYGKIYNILINANKRYLTPLLKISFAGIILFLMAFGIQGKFPPYNSPGLGLVPRSLEASDFLSANNIKGPILNDFASGSFLILTNFPNEKVFVDNRPEAYSKNFFDNIYFPTTEDKDSWQQISDTYKFNAIFIYQYAKAPKIRTFLYRRVRDPQWALVYAGTHHFVLLRNTKENSDVINQYKITKDNIGEKLEYLSNSPDITDQIAAADIFNLIGREDLGYAQNLKIVDRWPKNRKIKKVFMMMGAWKLFSNNNLNNYPLAIEYLEKAASLGQKTSDTYFYLAIAYKKIGEFEKSKKSIETALKINPDNQNALEFQNKLTK